MSIKSWLKEFYSGDAKYIPAKNAVAHSLKKWKGMREENAKRHGLNSSGTKVNDKKWEFISDTRSCALCQRYLDKFEGSRCAGCPLLNVLGNPCDFGNDSPFQRSYFEKSPEPMIEALEKALAYEKWKARK